MTFTTTRFLQRYRIECVSVLASLALSIWLISLYGVINIDGVLYLASAEAFIKGDWREAFDIYRWPLYAMLIAGTHQLLGLSLEASAYVLNTLCYAILVVAYIALVRTLGASRRTLWFAALFILLLPSLNDYRTFVIRDIGFWAFYLSGLLAFFRFQLRPSLGLALAWGSAMVVATLFRIEGIVFLLLLPLVLLWKPQEGWRRALPLFVQLNVLPLAGLAAVGMWLITTDTVAFSGRLLEPLMWLERFGEQVGGGLVERASLMEQHILNEYSDHLALPAVLGILLLILVWHSAKSLGLLGMGAAAYAWQQRAMPLPPNIRRSLLWLLTLNVAVLVVFATTMFFLTGRYVMALTLILALAVPFGLDRIYQRWLEGRAETGASRRWMFPVVVLLLCFMSVDSLWSFGTSKRYLRDAGRWLKQNVAADARVYSNDRILSFYADKLPPDWRETRHPAPVDEVLSQPAQWRQYDYMALVIRRWQELPPPVADVHVLREFSNNRNDRVLIFRVADLSGAP